MKYIKHLTVKQWKKFGTPQSAVILGNDRQYQYRNFFTQKLESQEYITGQEIILTRYKIILTDHQTRGEKLKAAYKKLKKIDIDKTLTKVTKNIDDFSKMMDGMKGIGGKQKDLSGLLGKRGKVQL